MGNQASQQVTSKLVTPSYYKGNAVLKFIELFGLNFSRGSAIKYIARAGHKDDELVDLQKAQSYINREVERLLEERRNNEQL